MRIEAVLTAPGQGAYFCEDIAALHAYSIPEDARASTPGTTPGFRFVRQAAETLSVGLKLEDGFVAWGDCVGVSYGGKAGREPLFQSIPAQRRLLEAGPQNSLKSIQQDLVRLVSGGANRRSDWVGRDISEFRLFSAELARSDWPMAVRYGLSQAALNAAAYLARETPWQVLCREWELPVDDRPVALQGSCGNDRVHGVEKLVFHRVDALPHTQVDDIALQFGHGGEVLIDYAQWTADRVRRESDYRPALHFDVHGALAKVMGGDLTRMADFVGRLAEATRGFECRLESPVIAHERGAQIEQLAALRERIASTGVLLVADEWANTRADIQAFLDARAVDMIHIKMPDLGGLEESLQSVLACRAAGVKSLLGGSCIETDLSTRLSVHVALAARPDVLLVKPGMGLHEGISIVRNEMARALCAGGKHGVE